MQNYDILALAGLRIDGRRSDDIRNMKHNFGLVKSADGSAYLEQGLNKVLAIVHGPQEPRKKLNDQSNDKVRISTLFFLFTTYNPTFIHCSAISFVIW
jgi:exosome complex component RRP41